MKTLQAPDELKKHLTACGSTIRRDRGTFLFHRGDEVTGVFLIVSGEVRLALEGNPPSFPSRHFGPGSVLGLPATLSNSSYSLDAEVTANAELVRVPREALLELLRKQAQLSFEIMNILSEELTETRNALSSIRKMKPCNTRAV